MADEIVKYGITGDVKPGNSIKVLNPATNNSYDVTVGKNNQHACSCPSFQFRGICKHVEYIIGKFPANAEGEDSGFQVKGKPKFNLSTTQGTASQNLVTILKQRMEEAKEKDKKERVVVTAHPGSEFKPENIPFTPDKDHPLLSKHDLATPEHNAGFQDSSMVHPMYKDSIRPDKTPDITEKTLDIKSTLAPSQNLGLHPGTKPRTESGTKPAVDDSEFKMKISREQMNKGGHYMPNESRPYRPGDTK